MRRGATLIELALTLVIVGTLMAIAVPGLRAATDRLAVDRAARDIATAHQRARITAVLQSRVVELTVDGGGLSIRARGATTDSWRGSGPTDAGVVLAGPSRVMTFSPVGLTMGLSNATFRLTRGAATRAVIVSRLGRVRITP